MDIIFLIGRVLLGGYFLMMGLNHFAKTQMLVGYAQARGTKSAKGAVLVGGLFLLLGGLGLLLGVYVRLAVILLVIFLVAVSFRIHHFWKDQDAQTKMVEMQNFLKNMALVGALLMIYTMTNWPLSIAP